MATNSKFSSNIPAIIDKVFEEGYIDNHTGWFGAKDDSMHKVDVIVLQTKMDGVTVCFATENSAYFSINPFYIDEEDNKVHLSTWSNGGVVKLYGDLEGGVAAYNAEMGYANWPNLFSQLTIIRRSDWEKKKAKEAELDRYMKEQEAKKSA